MEPTLHHGDVILVRKADAGFFPTLLAHAIFGNKSNDIDGNNDNDNEDAVSSSVLLAREQRRIRQYEMAIHHGGMQHQQGSSSGSGGGHSSSANWYENPPLVVSGQVVVLASPETAFPLEYIVKRVIGVGGQWLLPSLESNNTIIRRQQNHHNQPIQRIELLPPYSLYVQGDAAADDPAENNNNSRDCRHYGPISKNLLIGVAEYVVWPPRRWQRIARGRGNHDDNDDDDDHSSSSSSRRHMRRALWR